MRSIDGPSKGFLGPPRYHETFSGSMTSFMMYTIHMDQMVGISRSPTLILITGVWRSSSLLTWQKYNVGSITWVAHLEASLHGWAKASPTPSNGYWMSCVCFQEILSLSRFHQLIILTFSLVSNKICRLKEYEVWSESGWSMSAGHI